MLRAKLAPQLGRIKASEQGALGQETTWHMISRREVQIVQEGIKGHSYKPEDSRRSQFAKVLERKRLWVGIGYEGWAV